MLTKPEFRPQKCYSPTKVMRTKLKIPQCAWPCLARALFMTILIFATAPRLYAADPVISDPSATSIGVITGADPGEGLDLDGNFIYALSMGADPTSSFQVRGATFQGLIDAEVPGATLVAGNTIANWYPINYGDTPDDDNLEMATSSIRWSAAGAEQKTVDLTLENLTVGAQYKLQLMFGEQCCNRGFDVFVDGKLIVKDFNPGVVQGGINIGNQEALITHTFSATSPTVLIKLDGTTASADYNDHNAIFNALTVERLAGAGDTDADGLADTWEQFYFTNLVQTATGDPDGDTLTNAEELAAGSDPTKPDTDGDTLTDSQEIKTYKTDPKKPDTDGDKLLDNEEVVTLHTDPLKADSDGDIVSDFAEVRTYSTDPLKVDTDGDGANDYAEIHLLTDPKDATKKPSKTTANVFTGPDPGQGLDFQGTFPYALSFGNERVGGQIHDALFTADSVEGVLVEASQVADGWNIGVNYGDTPEQMVLSSVMESIRWSDAGNATIPSVTVTLSNLKVGDSYKLQMLFAERLWARGFNISVNGQLVAREFAPFQWQGGFTGPAGATPRTNGVVLVHTFVANSTNAVINIDGRPVTDPAMPDHNSIINGATLERLAAGVDSDSDGLWDAYETETFGNLTQTGAGDADGDGLSNSQEFTLNTNPNVADSDGDGLSDGQEVNTTHTDPAKTDTDGDGLSDGNEVNVSKTDPTKTDSDGDGLPDGDEVITLGQPTRISNVIIQPFSGGDPGEGLDLQGNFRYAVNVSSAGAAGKAGDADFTADTVSGVVVTAPSNIPNWDTPEYGDTPADNVLEKVTQSIRYGGTVRVLLTNLVPGSLYKLQMLFYEKCCGGRGFNIYADGELLAADFSPPNVQGGIDILTASAVVSAELETQRDKMSIILTVNGRTDPNLTDPNAILDGFTLEALREIQSAKPTLTLTRAAGGQVTITTDSTLQSADVVSGPYTSLPDKTVTLDPKTGAARKFYRATR
jgi:hypothetical protein